MKQYLFSATAFWFFSLIFILAPPLSAKAFSPVSGGAAESESSGIAANTTSQRWTWRNITPSQGQAPEPRRNGTVVYDPVGKRIIIFGGVGASGLLNDLWAFDLRTSSWNRLNPTGALPGPRLGHDAVYDTVGHQMVVWAGQQGSRFFNDTWTLNLNTLEWRDVSPAVRPRARYGSASVFDPVSRQLVQFAGFTEESRRFQDTQAFNLNTHTWQDLTPPGEKPQVRCLLTAALDRNSRRMIIYGGQRSGFLDDLWAFDFGSRSWTQLTPAVRPTGRFFATSFVDREGRFIVFGGSTSNGNVNETWAFNFETGQWSKLEIEAPPSARNGMMGAYIEEEDRFIVFGGTGTSLFSDIWELRNSQSTSNATLSFSDATFSITEDAGRATVTVTRTGDTSGQATVDYTTIDNAAPVACNDVRTMPNVAFARCDYATTVDTLRFAPGQSQQTFTIPIIDDVHIEGNETFQIVLSNAVGANMGAQATATVTINDDDTTPSAANPIRQNSFFVRQQYIDFLSREPELDGFNAWVGVLNRCPNVENDPSCDRIEVSASFFRSQEFQFKGYFVYLFYKVSLGRLPRYAEIIPDMRRVTGQTGDEVAAKKIVFTNEWVARQEFSGIYGSLTDEAYVDKLLQTADVTLTGTITRESLINDLQNKRKTRAEVLRAVVEHPNIDRKEYNGAFVAMQYYGYLRRDPDPDGYKSWLNVINRGDSYRVMVEGFMNSDEYKQRFGPPR